MLPTSLGAFPGLLLHPSPHPPGSPRAWTPGSPVWSRLPGWRPASGRGPAHTAWVATPAPPHAALGRRTGGQAADAEPLTWPGGAAHLRRGGRGRGRGAGRAAPVLLPPAAGAASLRRLLTRSLWRPQGPAPRPPPQALPGPL